MHIVHYHLANGQHKYGLCCPHNVYRGKKPSPQWKITYKYYHGGESSDVYIPNSNLLLTLVCIIDPRPKPFLFGIIIRCDLHPFGIDGKQIGRVALS